MIEAASPSLKGFKRGEPWRYAITSACNHNIWQLYIAGTESRSKFRFYSCDLVTIYTMQDWWKQMIHQLQEISRLFSQGFNHICCAETVFPSMSRAPIQSGIRTKLN
jgi:hypothetical protein